MAENLTGFEVSAGLTRSYPPLKRFAMRKDSVSLFVPGRLCLFGEHSDWAGIHRMMNAAIPPGRAIVTGIAEGITASAVPSKRFRMTSDAPQLAHFWTDFDAPADPEYLKKVAQSDSFFAYSAGTASYMLEHYDAGGVHLRISDMTLPLKKGFSSSAAACVLTARAFSRVYGLNLTTEEEMEAAFRGEERTRSRCGRLDQACAYGIRPVLMSFDGDRIETVPLRVGGDLHFVFADLCAGKNTTKILTDLARAYPFPETAADRALHRALGEENLRIVEKAVRFLAAGDAKQLGLLMNQSQKLFDAKIAPHSPAELASPRLHAVLADPAVRELSWGGKGVGSHGDGAIQFVAKDAVCQDLLAKRLRELGTRPYVLTLKPNRTVRKAVVPVAGLATRLFPASGAVRKEFFPLVDRDGLAKPAILLIFNELLASGIEEICLVLSREEDRRLYESFFAPVGRRVREKLSAEALAAAENLEMIADRLRFVYQESPRGFGDAVFRTREFAAGEPVLLVLGDTLHRSKKSVPCAAQLISSFAQTGRTTVAVVPGPAEKGATCGMACGEWLDADQRLMQITRLAEKPGAAYVRQSMGVKRGGRKKMYYAFFGQYILTDALYRELGDEIASSEGEGEIDLTGALERLRRKEGVLGFVPEGESFDLGTPALYAESFRRWRE